MALPLVPALAIPVSTQAKVLDGQRSAISTGGNEELSISLILGDKPMMLVTNNSDSLSILRRVHPGVVHAGETSYDLNHALMSSSYAIGAGRSRLIPITEAIGNIAEPTPSSRHSGKPLRVASISSNNVDGRILNDSRVFFA